MIYFCQNSGGGETFAGGGGGKSQGAPPLSMKPCTFHGLGATRFVALTTVTLHSGLFAKLDTYMYRATYKLWVVRTCYRGTNFIRMSLHSLAYMYNAGVLKALL